MSRRPLPRSPSGTTLAALVVLVAAPAVLAGQAPEAAVRQRLAELEQETAAPLHVAVSPTTGFVRFLGTQPDGPIRLAMAPDAPAADRARAFLDRHAELFGVGAPEELLLVEERPRDRLDIERVRYRQTIGGVPVAGGELAVFLRGASVVAVTAKLLRPQPTASVALAPSLDAAAAEQRARRLGDQLAIPYESVSQPELQVFQRGLLEGGRDTPVRLAWFVELRGTAVREYVWVDAASGAVLLHFDQRPSAKVREIYDAMDDDLLPGTLLGNEVLPPNGDADAELAFEGLGKTYDYFFTEHGRDSYDGAGATLVASVHYCEPDEPSGCPFANAFWNGQQMVFGDGFASGDDVVAHELSHAVTEHTANLFYYMQSGALNESFSDIFGETVDLVNADDGGDDTDPAVRWLVAEDVFVGGLRDMLDPTAKNDPGKMTDTLFVCAAPGGDAGGVHTNSGVPNHAYALMVDGGSYNGFTVTGIGLAKAARIQYRALTTYLLSASDFLDTDLALRQSCLDLVGTAGISGSDCTQVGTALDAVEMSFQWPCVIPDPTVVELCPAGGEPTTLLLDDFENTASTLWDLQVLGGTGIHWDKGIGHDDLYNASFATSGLYHLWGNNLSVLGHTAVEMTEDIAIPANGRLQFLHSFGFDTSTVFEDGGVIEYSTNGGGTWNDAGGLIVAGMPYFAPALDASNPMGAIPAFASDSRGYTKTQLDLSSLAGEDVRFRFRMGTNLGSPAVPEGGDYGWFIDDFHVYSCAGATVLVDQTSSVTTIGIPSQSFEPSQAAADSEAAADFTSGATLRIGGAEILGQYTGSPNFGGPTPRFNLSFRSDAGGTPGAAICSYTGLRAGIDFGDQRGDISVTLPSACCLPAGKHWVVAQADMDFSTRRQWFWTLGSVQTGDPFSWQNPGNGFGTGCTTWDDGPTCLNVPHPDLAFSLWQVPAPPADVVLEEVTLAATALHEAGSTLSAQDVRVLAPAQVTLRAGTSVSLDELRVESGATLRVQIAPATGCP